MRKRKVDPKTIATSFWTPEMDKRLLRLEAAGFPVVQIAERLGTTAGNVNQRAYLLRKVAAQSGPTTEEIVRAKAARRRKELQRRENEALAEMRSALARGAARDRVIAEANKKGAGFKAIAKQFGVSRQRVHQIVLLED
jgi:DNA-binding transcriptional regulator YdaS (Cro superfamily)